MDRRTFVTGAAAGGLTLVAGTDVTSAARRAARKRVVRGGAFHHGVAAGAPGERDVLLWTRLSDVSRSSRVRLEVARDADFRQVVERRVVDAVRWRDFTARQRVTKGLVPGEQYFYRWETATAHSPVGRFRTALPADSREPARSASSPARTTSRAITRRWYFGPATPVTEQGVRANNPHYAFADWRHRGYGVLEARRDELLVTYRSPSTVAQPQAEMRDLARFRVAAGSTAVERI